MVKNGEPIGFVFVHTDGSMHDFSLTEHSAGMTALYKEDLERVLANELKALSERFFARGPLPSGVKCALEAYEKIRGESL